MTTKKSTKKVTPSPYKAILRILGHSYQAEGKSVSEAIEKIKPGIAKGRGILTIQIGERTKDRILLPIQTSRLFNSTGLMREVALKQTSLLFEGL